MIGDLNSRPGYGPGLWKRWGSPVNLTSGYHPQAKWNKLTRRLAGFLGHSLPQAPRTGVDSSLGRIRTELATSHSHGAHTIPMCARLQASTVLLECDPHRVTSSGPVVLEERTGLGQHTPAPCTNGTHLQTQG